MVLYIGIIFICCFVASVLLIVFGSKEIDPNQALYDDEHDWVYYAQQEKDSSTNKTEDVND